MTRWACKCSVMGARGCWQDRQPRVRLLALNRLRFMAADQPEADEGEQDKAAYSALPAGVHPGIPCASNVSAVSVELMRRWSLPERLGMRC